MNTPQSVNSEYEAKRADMAAEIKRLKAALEASEKVCKIISEYMSSGEFFDLETSKAIYEWQALKGGAQ